MRISVPITAPAVRRHLDSPARHALRPVPRRRPQPLAEQAHAHPVRLRAEPPGPLEEGLQLIRLETRGIAAGDHVATMIPNSAEAYLAWLGLAWLRAVEVPLNNGYQGRMLQYTLSQSDSTMLVIHRRFVDRLASIADECSTLCIGGA